VNGDITFGRVFSSSRLGSLFAGFAFILIASLCSSAQTATILGSVTDPSGAAIPDAQVNVTNIDTNRVAHFTTNSVGQYVAPNLGIGHYNVQVQPSSFQPASQQGIAGQNGGISTNLGSSNFGAVTAAFDPRVFQLALKLLY
jgi:hypothetical protein